MTPTIKARKILDQNSNEL
jgi:hypothetical protein